jgi:hypothetical protein
MNKSRKNLLTPVIKGMDKRIGALYANIKRVIRAYENDVDTNRSASAKRLHQAMDKYWNVTRKSMITQIADMLEIIDRIDTSTVLTGDLTVLVLTATWAMLKSEVDAFHIIYQQRLVEDSKPGIASASSIREIVIKCYERYCDMLMQIIELDPVEDLELLLNEINILRTKYAPKHPTALDPTRTSVEPLPIQIYDERPSTPIPRVFFQTPKETIELVFTKDFFVSYRNNEIVGEAILIIHGKGGYNGQYITTFHIAQQV